MVTATRTPAPIDPWTEWAERGGSADFLDERIELLAELPDIEGGWPNPASLSRFGLDAMTPDLMRRFRRKWIVAELGYRTPCWIWTAGTHEKGYGRFHLGNVTDDSGLRPVEVRITAYSHRISFEHYVGFPPPGYIVDHECNNKLCCNPTHLWPQTNVENIELARQRRPWKGRNQYSKK